jgi:D-sedoheptulose 7-phosphate isomerase
MSDIEAAIGDAYQNAVTALQGFLTSGGALLKTKEAVSLISKTLLDWGKVIVCGNGGSACDAMHFCEELTGRFRDDRKPLPAIALTDPAHLTAVGNDYGFTDVFSRGVQAHGKEDDVFIGLSTSGNSENVVKARGRKSERDEGHTSARKRRRQVMRRRGPELYRLRINLRSYPGSSHDHSTCHDRGYGTYNVPFEL